MAEEEILNPKQKSYSSESRNEDLCKQIINDMNVYGLSVVDDFLGKQKGMEILNEVHSMYSAGVFQVIYMQIINLHCFSIKRWSALVNKNI